MDGHVKGVAAIAREGNQTDLPASGNEAAYETNRLRRADVGEVAEC